MSINNRSTKFKSNFAQKFLKQKDRVSITTYWTRRYLTTLCIGLAIAGFISALWIRHQALENRLDMMMFLAENTADSIVAHQKRDSNSNPNRVEEYFLAEKKISRMDIEPFSYIVDTDGIIISRNRPEGPLNLFVSPTILNNDRNIGLTKINNVDFYIVKAPIEFNESIIGWVLFVDSKENLTYVNHEYTQLAIMIISLALLGWGAIYALSKRLAKPIKDVAKAAKLVSAGNYQVNIPNESKELEVYELVQSFKEMTGKLEKLERLRTELLAGVTHELKTPVTSISGLLQAVKDEIVTGEEAKEFLTISLNETEKMKTMVEDLLTFNQFSTNIIQVNREKHFINDIVEDAVFIWEASQKDAEIQIELVKLSKDVEVETDPIRLQQIMTNLLNNAKQAIENKGNIRIMLSEDLNCINIDVADTGHGIPENEQPFIFERFFRGNEKKYKVRGLGLGLSLSKMIAQALGGELLLMQSSNQGTTFRVILPKN